MSEYIIYESPCKTVAYFGETITTMHCERREEIVRCRGCKHYEEPQPKNGWNGYCTTKEHDTVPGGFCKWGERRESNGD